MQKEDAHFLELNYGEEVENLVPDDMTQYYIKNISVMQSGFQGGYSGRYYSIFLYTTS